MRKANLDIRVHASQSGVYMYEVARRLGMHDSNFSRLLRFELPPDKKSEISKIIDDITKEAVNNEHTG